MRLLESDLPPTCNMRGRSMLLMPQPSPATHSLTALFSNQHITYTATTGIPQNRSTNISFIAHRPSPIVKLHRKTYTCHLAQAPLRSSATTTTACYCPIQARQVRSPAFHILPACTDEANVSTKASGRVSPQPASSDSVTESFIII